MFGLDNTIGIHLEILWIVYFLSNMRVKHMKGVQQMAGEGDIGVHTKLIVMEIIKIGNMHVAITIVTNKLLQVVPVNGITIQN